MRPSYSFAAVSSVTPLPFLSVRPPPAHSLLLATSSWPPARVPITASVCQQNTN